MANNSLGQVGSIFGAGIWKENPVLRLLIGMCPTLAVTAALKPALTMGACVIFVLICSNLVVSSMRHLLKPHLRILMFTLTIATFVTIADLFLKAYIPDMSAKLGPYIPLIIVNCIIIARAEACASKSNMFISGIDGLAMGLGFTVAIGILAVVRKIGSAGAVFGYRVMPKAFVPSVAIAMPVGAFVSLGIILALVSIITNKKKSPGART